MKDELSQLAIASRDSAINELYGTIAFARGSAAVLTTENINVASRILAVAGKVNPCGDAAFIRRTGSYYSVEFKENFKRSLINSAAIQSLESSSALRAGPDFMRGTFLVCGSVTDPRVDYHLEFSLSDEQAARLLCESLSKTGVFGDSPRFLKRRSSYVVYVKDNEQITDFLTFIGATNSSMNFMQTKMIKEARNYINRTTNFETANITKITCASSAQIKAIERIKRLKGLDYLPEPLREIAKLRLDNPYASLGELAEAFPGEISKSGVNHRLRKIMEISSSLWP